MKNFRDVDELSPWIPIELKMPKAKQTVYVIVEVEVVTKPKVETKQFQTMAQYIPYLAVPEEDFIAEDYQGDGDYDEESDTYFTLEGWYEYQLESDIHFKLSEKVTHWMPLFELPKKSNDVCGMCKGEKWINKGMETTPCPSCGCTGVKKN